MATKTNVLKYLGLSLAWTVVSCSQADSYVITAKKNSAPSEVSVDDALGSHTHDDPLDNQVEVEAEKDNCGANLQPFISNAEGQKVVSPEQTKSDNLTMLACGKLISQFNVKDPAGFGTSAANPIVVKIPVSKEGVFTPPNTTVLKQQVPGVKDSLMGDKPFAGVTNLHAGMKICNDTANNLQLHSDNSGPVEHGDPIQAGTCAIMLVARGVANSGATYRHGDEKKQKVFIKSVKVLPDGSEMP